MRMCMWQRRSTKYISKITEILAFTNSNHWIQGKKRVIICKAQLVLDLVLIMASLMLDSRAEEKQTPGLSIKTHLASSSCPRVPSNSQVITKLNKNHSPEISQNRNQRKRLP